MRLKWANTNQGFRDSVLTSLYEYLCPADSSDSLLNSKFSLQLPVDSGVGGGGSRGLGAEPEEAFQQAADSSLEGDQTTAAEGNIGNCSNGAESRKQAVLTGRDGPKAGFRCDWGPQWWLHNRLNPKDRSKRQEQTRKGTLQKVPSWSVCSHEHGL